MKEKIQVFDVGVYGPQVELKFKGAEERYQARQAAAEEAAKGLKHFRRFDRPTGKAMFVVTFTNASRVDVKALKTSLRKEFGKIGYRVMYKAATTKHPNARSEAAKARKRKAKKAAKPVTPKTLALLYERKATAVLLLNKASEVCEEARKDAVEAGRALQTAERSLGITT